MDKKAKQDALKQVPIRKLMASIKLDIRKELRPSAFPGKQKKK